MKALCLSLMLMASLVQADLIAGQDIIPAPASVADDFPGAENTAQQAFNERQDYTLLRNIRIDNAAPFAGSTSSIYLDLGSSLFIVRGTMVDSHMIFLNTRSGSASDLGVVWTFADPIIGVMSDSNGLFEAGSNVEVGNPGTAYPGSFSARGLEGNDGYSISADFRSITVNMTVSEPGDWIRVITAANSPVPEPSTFVLLAGAAAAFAWRRRRRS